MKMLRRMSSKSLRKASKRKDSSLDKMAKDDADEAVDDGADGETPPADGDKAAKRAERKAAMLAERIARWYPTEEQKKAVLDGWDKMVAGWKSTPGYSEAKVAENLDQLLSSCAIDEVAGKHPIQLGLTLDALIELQRHIPLEWGIDPSKEGFLDAAVGYLRLDLAALLTTGDESMAMKMAKAGSPHVGRATLFVSWAMSMDVKELTSGLERYMVSRPIMMDDGSRLDPSCFFPHRHRAALPFPRTWIILPNAPRLHAGRRLLTVQPTAPRAIPPLPPLLHLPPARNPHSAACPPPRPPFPHPRARLSPFID